MIRIVALAVCLAGLGAIAVAATRSPLQQSADAIFPTVAGNKADRLTINSNLETLTDVDKVNVAYAPPTEERRIISPPPLPRSPKEVTISAAPDFVPRHWHDPHDTKTKAVKPRTSDGRQAGRRLPASTLNQVAEARSCRSDGLDPLLRKLKLSPQCNP